jgi:AAA domain/UvrD-like helicase C-terminal domain
MPEPAELAAMRVGAIVAPAGHGKTEVIAKVAALGRRALILTHTHAGVHAIRNRLKRLGISHHAVAVDTIAGWCMRYANAFPGVAKPPEGMPRNGHEWDQLYRGTILALRVQAVRDVVVASYDKILIDEYQDCNLLQHALAVALSEIVPTLIFGDPMQGIFEFAGATLNWDGQIHDSFPFAGSLDKPYRWQGKNPELGAWIAQTREKLMAGEPIDLAEGPITYRQTDDVFDMGLFFDGIDGREGTQAAIHCRKGVCYRLARATRGGFQAIEEMAAGRLQNFAVAWDASSENARRLAAVKSLIDECIHKKQVQDGEPPDSADDAMAAEMNAIAKTLGEGNGAGSLRKIFALSRKRPRWRIFRGEIWRDAERAIAELDSERCETMSEAAANIRQRMTNSGRRLPTRTVSTPLLLKGLEFDHVMIPNAAHFANEDSAQAKLFYVAISRATKSLTVASSNRFLKLPKPLL